MRLVIIGIMTALASVNAQAQAGPYDFRFEQGARAFPNNFWFVNNSNRTLLYCSITVRDKRECTAQFQWTENARYGVVAREKRNDGGRGGSYCRVYGGTQAEDTAIWLFDSQTGNVRVCRLGCDRKNRIDKTVIQCEPPSIPTFGS